MKSNENKLRNWALSGQINPHPPAHAHMLKRQCIRWNRTMNNVRPFDGR